MIISYKPYDRGISMQTKFLWGGAISAGQTEGNSNHAKSKLSNFDMLPMDKRRLQLVYRDDDNNIFNTYNNDHHPSDLGIDFYHTYIQDIKLLHDLGINAFRFSISWTRLFPTGEETTPNRDGMNFYRGIFRELKKYNMEPIVTLSHFEIPLNLVTKYGGWSNRKVIDLFLHYTNSVMTEFSEYVDYWIPFNELNMILHIPFIGGGLIFTKEDNILQKEYQAAHYQLLANSLVIKQGRKINREFKFGCMIAAGRTYPYSPNPEDVWAANLSDRKALLFSDVQVRGNYPSYFNNLCKQNNLTLDITSDDLQLLKNNTVDFVSFSYYSSACSAADGDRLEHTATNGFETVKNPYLSNEDGVWQIDPLGLRITLNQLYERYEKPVFIVENGLGTTKDRVTNGKIHDPYRIKYLEQHFSEMRKAVEEDGIPLIGYLMWGVIDLVSVSEGKMSKRYGVIYVDLDDFENGTNKRIKKDSFFWFKNYLSLNSLGENNNEKRLSKISH